LRSFLSFLGPKLVISQQHGRGHFASDLFTNNFQRLDWEITILDWGGGELRSARKGHDALPKDPLMEPACSLPLRQCLDPTEMAESWFESLHDADLGSLCCFWAIAVEVLPVINPSFTDAAICTSVPS
jgi:hypothetical protein